MSWLKELKKTNENLQSMRPSLENSIAVAQQFSTQNEQDDFCLQKWISQQTGENL